VTNLEIGNYLSSGFKRHNNGNPGGKHRQHQYDLYAVVNHIMYHGTGGGHYTSYVLSEP
jgi:fructosamine-3-kinase